MHSIVKTSEALRVLNQARSTPSPVNRLVRTARTTVHHHNVTQCCSTETVLLRRSFHNYGRPLSVAWAKSMLYFANVFPLFLWPPYAPAQVNGGSRNFYTWWTLSVNRGVTTWIFFVVLPKLQGGPKSDEIWHIFKPRPQTFCSYSRTWQNIVILKKTC